MGWHHQGCKRVHRIMYYFVMRSVCLAQLLGRGGHATSTSAQQTQVEYIKSDIGMRKPLPRKRWRYDIYLYQNLHGSVSRDRDGLPRSVERRRCLLHLCTTKENKVSVFRVRWGSLIHLLGRDGWIGKRAHIAQYDVVGMLRPPPQKRCRCHLHLCKGEHNTVWYFQVMSNQLSSKN